jgi:hypothetical protein
MNSFTLLPGEGELDQVDRFGVAADSASLPLDSGAPPANSPVLWPPLSPRISPLRQFLRLPEQFCRPLPSLPPRLSLCPFPRPLLSLRLPRRLPRPFPSLPATSAVVSVPPAAMSANLLAPFRDLAASAAVSTSFPTFSALSGVSLISAHTAAPYAAVPAYPTLNTLLLPQRPYSALPRLVLLLW